MAVDMQIHYWAHMLDESKHDSYYKVYMLGHPEDKHFPLVDALIEEFANDLAKHGFKWNSLLGEDGYVDDKLLDKAIDSLKPHYRWELIPAQTYAAIMTRYVAMMDAAQGQRYLAELDYADVRRGVLKKTVERCLDIICHNVNVLDANNDIVNNYATSSIESIFTKHGVPKLLHYSRFQGKDVNDCYVAVQLYIAWASYTTGKMGEKHICDSDNGPDKVKEVLDECEYDADEIDLIVTLNKAIDVVHFRSDLAAAFLEGGKQTASIVSSLPSNLVI